MFQPRFATTLRVSHSFRVAAVSAPADRAVGQIFRSTVGGVIINADGVLDVASPEMQQTATQMLQEKMQAVPEDLGPQTELRMVSLRGICEQIVALGVTETSELPDELRCLAGLQRVEYVVVVPERNDILLAGPGEAWTLHAPQEITSGPRPANRWCCWTTCWSHCVPSSPLDRWASVVRSILRHRAARLYDNTLVSNVSSVRTWCRNWSE